LADTSKRIGRESPKTSVPQRKLLARDQLIDYYRNFANEQAEYGWKFHQYITRLVENVDELEVVPTDSGKRKE